MYTQTPENQALFSTFPINATFEPASLRGAGKKVWDVFYRFKHLPFFQLTNEFIAHHAQCDVRTVKRWTSKWENLGLITKSRRHLYDVNNYTLNISKKQSFQLWFNRLTTQEQEFYNTHGMTIQKYNSLNSSLQSVPLSYSSPQLARYLTSSSSITVIDSLSNARATLVYQDPKIFETISNVAAFSKKEAVMKDEVVKEATKHVQSLSLTKWGQIALSAYPDEAIEYADQIVSNSKTTAKNPFAFFISFCKQYCEKKGISADFGLVLRLEEKWGARQDRIFINPMPVKHKKEKQQQHTPYPKDAPQVPSIEQLRSTIQVHEETLAALPCGDRKKADIKANIFICKQLLNHQGGMIEDSSNENVPVSAMDKFVQEGRELKRQINHLQHMVENPGLYFKPPNKDSFMALFMDEEMWVSSTAALRRAKIERLKLLIVEGDKHGFDPVSIYVEQENLTDNMNQLQ